MTTLPMTTASTRLGVSAVSARPSAPIVPLPSVPEAPRRAPLGTIAIAVAVHALVFQLPLTTHTDFSSARTSTSMVEMTVLKPEPASIPQARFERP